MKIKIHELATKEFDEAIDWYENQTKGLGKRFRKSVIDQLSSGEILEVRVSYSEASKYDL